MKPAVFTPDVRPRLPACPHSIGIIGCGSIVRHGHLPAYRKYGLNVAAIASRTEASVNSVGDQFGIARRFTDFRGLLDIPQIDVVDITVPFDEPRLEMVREAAARGKHILMQKPLAHTMNAAREMVETAQRAGVQLAVNLNARWCPQYRAAYFAIREGLVGKPTVLTHHMRNTQDSADWFHQGYYANQPRFQLIEYTVHHIDLMRFWMQREPGRVQATIVRRENQRARVEMTVSVQMTFGNDALAVVTDDNAAPPVAPISSRFHIDGTSGMIEGDAMREPHVKIWSAQLDSTPFSPTFHTQWFPDGFAGTMGELLCAIDEKRESKISGRDHLNTLKLIFDAYQSTERD